MKIGMMEGYKKVQEVKIKAEVCKGKVRNEGKVKLA